MTTIQLTKKSARAASANGQSVQLHIGNVQDMGGRFIAAWQSAQSQPAVPESHITFMNLETMLGVLSTKRLEMLRHIHAHGAESIRALSIALQRDYKNIHTDVVAMVDVGLLIQDNQTLTCPWAQVQASLTL